MSVVGTIDSIWRYPVKSMRGEELDEAFVAFAGLMGDRLYGVVKGGGNPGFPWHTAREQESLLLYQHRYKHQAATLKPQHLEAAQGMAPGINPLYPETEQFSVEVETSAGETYSLGDGTFLDHLKTFTDDQTLSLKFTQRSQYDCRPLSLFSLQMSDLLTQELEMEIDKRRFRANLYVNWNEDKPYETELVGRRLKIGEMLEINVLERDPRCKMITLDPDTSEATPDIVKHVNKAHSGFAGVYGAVLVEGVVKAGDSVQLID
ncbi:MAG: MOSC N-terminal beta barrel domain-containing protein [Cyanobacteria bacterium P01_A01_bin.137]